MHSLKSYVHGEIAYDNNAYTTASTFHRGILKIFTCYPVRSTPLEAEIEDHIHQVRAFCMDNPIEAFRQSATAYRNLRDWAEEQRNPAIEQANTTKRAKARAGATAEAAVSTTASDKLPSEQKPGDTSKPDNDEISQLAGSLSRSGSISAGCPSRQSSKKLPKRQPGRLSKQTPKKAYKQLFKRAPK